jgi:hypothetical protein
MNSREIVLLKWVLSEYNWSSSKQTQDQMVKELSGLLES